MLLEKNDYEHAANKTDMITGHIKELRGVLKYNEPMADHTSWRAGGSADHYFEPADLEDLITYLKSVPADKQLLWVGLGSNLLVRDGGFRGSVIALNRAFNNLEINTSGQIKVDAGVPCAKVARCSAREGYTGAEFLAGIPGTMGGALAMNAGAFGGETWNIVTRVRTLSRSGMTNIRLPADFNIGYRSVQIPGDEWFISAELQLQKDHEKIVGQRIRDLLEKRSATQPTGLPSCGSVFRNPTGDYAARLIDACGLKGKRIGNASISEKHANFIINHGNATASDIERLISFAQQSVQEQFGVELIPEVRIVGESKD
jgi:UDP-N-acetylmuramate dehydrogenase